MDSTRLVLLVVDLTGYTTGFHSHTDAEMAAFLDAYYGVAEDAVARSDGQVLKYIGDALLAIFPPDQASGAVAAATEMEAGVRRIARERGIDAQVGANIHLGAVVMGQLGRGANRRLDVIGRAVNQTFLLGRGAGIRISEPAYRQLPSAERTPWEKRKPPAVYVLGARSEPFGGPRQSAAENAARW